MPAYDTEFRLLYARDRAERLRLDAQPTRRRKSRRFRLLQRELPLLSPARRRATPRLSS
jgi:hypothetical protein